MTQTTKNQRTRIKKLAVRSYENQTKTSLEHQKYNRYLADDGTKVVIKTSNDYTLLSNVRSGEDDLLSSDAPLEIEDTDFVVFVPMYHKPDTRNPAIYNIPSKVVVDRMKNAHKKWQDGELKGDSRRALVFRDAPNASDKAQSTYGYQEKFKQYRIDDAVVVKAADIVDDGGTLTDTGEDPGNAVILGDLKDYRVAEVASIFLETLRELQQTRTLTTYSEIWETLYADLRFNFPILMKVMDLGGRKHYEETGDIGLLSLIRRDDGVLPEGFLDWADKVRVR